MKPAIVARGTQLAHRTISSVIQPIFAWNRSGSATATMTVVTIRMRTIRPVHSAPVPATVSDALTTTAAFRPLGTVTETTIVATELMNLQIIANRAPKLVSATSLRATTATAFHEFTSAMEITIVSTTLTKITDTNAEAANATLKRNSLAAPTNNGVCSI
jgi:hypothetical protein